MAFYGPYGMGVATDREEYSEYFVKALNDAFTERQLALDVFVCEGAYCGAHGYLVANFTGFFLGNDFHYLKNVDNLLFLFTYRRRTVQYLHSAQIWPSLAC